MSPCGLPAVSAISISDVYKRQTLVSRKRRTDMAENNEYKVEVRHLYKNFGSLEVLKDCNFNVKRGEFICVVGPDVYKRQLL